MANYTDGLAQGAVCQSHTVHMTGLWFLPARTLMLNANEGMNMYKMLFTGTSDPVSSLIFSSTLFY